MLKEKNFLERVIWPDKHEETTVLIRLGRVLDYLGRILCVILIVYPIYLLFAVTLGALDPVFSYTAAESPLMTAAVLGLPGIGYFIVGRVLRYILSNE